MALHMSAGSCSLSEVTLQSTPSQYCCDNIFPSKGNNGLVERLVAETIDNMTDMASQVNRLPISRCRQFTYCMSHVRAYVLHSTTCI